MLNVRLFGKFEVSLDGQSIAISSRPMQSLLAYLILNADTTHRREKLAGLLWPESDEKSARQKRSSGARHVFTKLDLFVLKILVHAGNTPASTSM